MGTGAQNGASLSLEPGGQFELSGAPLQSVHETCAEVATHLKQTREIAGEIGVGVLGIGFAPSWSLAETPMMPKGRYKIMRDYMPRVGGYGLDMMFRTCTVQVNLDFESEADMVKKFRVGLALQPSPRRCSPIHRSARAGPAVSVLPGAGVDRWSTMPAPACCPGCSKTACRSSATSITPGCADVFSLSRRQVYRHGGARAFAISAGKIAEVAHITPMLSDWADHLTTIFPRCG